MKERTGPTTSIARSDANDVLIRGRSLCAELIGKVGFTELMYLHVTGRAPTPGQVAVLDACLVALMEHGITPSVIASRMVLGSAPEAMQAAVAAGLLAVGSVFVGTVEGCAALLVEIVAADDVDAKARAIVAEHRAAGRRVPGFGHPVHKPDDPRTPALMAVAEAAGVKGDHARALEALARAVDEAHGKHVTVNATGAVAALLADAGIPAEIMRGIALIARAAGLVGHLHEEQRDPAMPEMWQAAERAVPYVDE